MTEADKLVIRLVDSADSAEWLRLRNALWPDEKADNAVQVERFLACYPRQPLEMLHEVFVCERPEGGLCGMLEVSIRTTAPGCATNHIGYLEGWYVDADWRGRGVGRALVEQAEAWARAQGSTEMASDTTPDYPTSPAAHAALGYVETERYFRKEL